MKSIFTMVFLNIKHNLFYVLLDDLQKNIQYINILSFNFHGPNTLKIIKIEIIVPWQVLFVNV